MRYSQYMENVPDEMPPMPPAPVEAPEPDDDDEGCDDDASSLYRFPISIVVKSIQLTLRMKTPENLPDVIALAAAFSLPPEKYPEFANSCEARKHSHSAK